MVLTPEDVSRVRFGKKMSKDWYDQENIVFFHWHTHYLVLL